MTSNLAGHCPATGKQQFVSKRDAKTARKTYNTHRDGHHKQLRSTYQCPHCDHWHNTSLPSQPTRQPTKHPSTPTPIQ